VRPETGAAVSYLKCQMSKQVKTSASQAIIPSGSQR
jgi:hypothetical protein